MRENTNTIHPDCLRYLNEKFGVEDEKLVAIREYASSQDREGMQVSPFEGQMLQSLVRWSGAEKVLEIGTLFGYSTLWMARGLGPDGRLISVEKSEERHHTASESLAGTEVADKVSLRCGDIEDLKADIEHLTN